MSLVEARITPRGLSSRSFLVGTAVVAILLGIRVSGAGDHPSAQSFTLVFTAIVVEALPFVLLGALVAAALTVYVPDRLFERIGRLPVPLQLPAAGLGGFAFPVCECGSVPVARRLIARGVHPSAGIAFMLSAPVFNPVVLGATWVAYEARGLGPEMVAGRAALGLVVAMIIGWAIGTEHAEGLLRERPCEEDSCCSHGHDRGSFAMHLTDELFHIGRFLVLGAALAAAMQTLLPSGSIAGAASSPLFASVVLMGLAFVSSLCSEADAFVAVSFAPLPIGSQLAFLTFGPILDLKLFFMYGASFSKRMLLSLAAMAVPLTIAGSLWFELVVG